MRDDPGEGSGVRAAHRRPGDPAGRETRQPRGGSQVVGTASAYPASSRATASTAPAGLRGSRSSGPGSRSCVPTAPVTLVATAGQASMDRYGQQLAAHLSVPSVLVDTSAASAGRFGARSSAAVLRGDLRLVRRLRALPGVLHLTHHHLARYALALGRPYLLTSHDLIRWHDLTGRAVHIAPPRGIDRLGLRADYAAVRRAAHVLAPSEATRGELVRLLEVPPEQVTVVPLGLDHALFRPVAPHRTPWPYVLFVGSEHPRKNLEAVLRAVALLKARPEHADLRLVKVGAPGDGEAPFRARTARLVEELGLQREVVFVGEVPDADLPGWYAGAACLVLPSRSEGFGLPPLEAMACGCPAVVSSAGSLPEVTGGAALVVPPEQPGELADAVAGLLASGPLRHRLRARGLRRAAEFSWERAARETVQVYERLLSAPGEPGRVAA